MNSDPLDVNVDDIDFSYPIIPAALYDFRIKSVEVKPNKEGSGENLVFQLATQTEIQSVKGESVPIGFVLTHNISLRETEKYTLIEIGKRIAAVAQAAQVRGVTPRDIIRNPQQLVGRVVTAKVQISKERTDARTGTTYNERSEIHSFVVKK